MAPSPASRYTSNAKGTGAKAERRVGERGDDNISTPPPTHAAPPLSFSLPRDHQRKKRGLALANSPAPQPQAHSDPNPNPTRRRRDGPACEASQPSPWTGEPGGMDPEKRGYELRILPLLRLPVAAPFLDSIRLAGGRSRRPAKQRGRAFAPTSTVLVLYTRPQILVFP